MEEKTPLTPEGLSALWKELEQLRADRTALTRQIREAREKGDLSENEDYKEALDRRRLVDMRITNLEDLFAQAGEPQA